MHGFKSFAEPVTIEFNDGITCIVGPNGSGKSNISDALRWVLGEQSPKALRGGKMDEVIFAGTASRKSRGMAEVTLTIDNSTGILPIDYNEVAITRRMYRSGESEYLINNNHCRLRDIRELIMDTGIGVDGYSIIGQGKIADIVSNKPESRREIFEEAAGIVMYRTKKADVEKKLAASNANLERVNDIVSEIESRIGSLKTDSEKATEYLNLREKYKELEVNITLKNVDSLDLKMEYLKDDISEASSDIEELKEEKAEIDKASAENRLRSETLETLTQETSAKLISAIDEINTLVNRSEVNRERVTAIDDNRSRLAAELESLGDKLEKEKESAQGLIIDKSQKDEELARLKASLSEHVEEYEKMTKLLGNDAADIDEKRSSIYELHSKAQSRRAEANSLENLRITLSDRKNSLILEKSEALAGKEDAERVSSEEAANEQALLTEAEEKKEQVRSLTSKYNDGLAEEKRLAKQLEELRISIGQLTGRKKTMEEMEASYEGYSYAVRYIMKSHLNGINGVVADLMTVPSGYETAIETALGAALQNIVCADDMSAKKAIAMLKESKAGRLTFLPIASIRGGVNRENRVMAAKGFKGYGCDCVEYDAKYKNIFEYLLGRTVVVETMDDAIALSKNGGGLRFVTLDGEVITASGAITGGRHKNTTGNLLERKAEITKLESDIQNGTSELENIGNKLSELRRFLENTSSDISKAQESIKTLEMELIMCRNRLEIARSVLADIETTAAKSESELVRLEEESAKSAEMISRLLSEAEEAEKLIEEATSAANTAMELYEEKKAQLADVNEEIVKARMAVTVCEEQKNSADSMVARVNESIADITRQIEEKTAENENLLAQRNEITFGHDDIEALIAEKNLEKQKLESYAAEISDEKAAVTAELSESSRKKEAADEKLLALQNSKYEMEVRLARDETQLEHLKNKLWEEFEITYAQAVTLKKRDFAMNTAVKESREIKSRIKALGDVNVGAIKEYAQVGERYEFLVKQRQDILDASDSLSGIISDMDKTIKQKFKESFDSIVTNFEEIFMELFGGGHAELRLEDENNPLESGIEIIAQPPGKKLQNINLMSGGEKTMTAIALMFAVLKSKPTPFCILDEVEAALDDVNIDRFADYLKKFENIQFALVTHQRATMEHADALYGVTMPEQGISKLISLRLGDEFEL